MRTWTLTMLVGLAAAGAVHAQAAAPCFRWQKGQVLTYRVEHRTAVAEVVAGSKVETSSQHDLTKHWRVLDVDAQGIATLELSLAAMRMEQTRPNGELLRYDSANPDKSDPALKEQLDKFINQPLAVLKVGPSGKVVEVIKGMPGSYESEPPFVLILPPAPLSVGQSWERSFPVVLAPPQGTGERYEGTQKLVCQRADAAGVVFALTTSFKNMPASQLDQVPLLQKQPQGQVMFDVQNGRLHAARLVIDRELHDHQGRGSSYHFQSTYSEQYLP